MTQQWAALGEGGSKIGFQILRDMYEEGWISEKEVDSSQSTTGTGGILEESSTTKEENKNDIGERPPYLQSAGGVDITFYGMDSDSAITENMAVVDEKLYNQLIKPRETEYLLQLAGRTVGTGGVYEIISNLDLETTPKFIKAQLKDSGTFFPIFSLDGGSGFGSFEQHIQEFQHGEIRRPNIVAPIGIAPLRTQGTREVKTDQPEDVNRQAFESTTKALTRIKSLMAGNGGVNYCVVVDNNMAAFNSVVNENISDNEYSYILDKMKPIVVDGDWSEFDMIPDNWFTHAGANRSISKSLYPIFGTAGKIDSFTKASAVAESEDLAGDLGGRFIVPSHLSLPTRSRIYDIFPNREFDDFNDELAWLSWYTFLISCAPVKNENVESIRVAVWTKKHDAQGGVGRGFGEKARTVFEQAGLDPNMLQIHPVVDLDTTSSDIELWTMTGADDVAEVIESQYR